VSTDVLVRGRRLPRPLASITRPHLPASSALPWLLGCVGEATRCRLRRHRVVAGGGSSRTVGRPTRERTHGDGAASSHGPSDRRWFTAQRDRRRGPRRDRRKPLLGESPPAVPRVGGAALERIAQGLNPEMVEQVPGLPPTRQILAEQATAMTQDAAEAQAPPPHRLMCPAGLRCPAKRQALPRQARGWRATGRARQAVACPTGPRRTLTLTCRVSAATL